MIRKFRIHWLTGKSEDIEIDGFSIEDDQVRVMRMAGIGGGALSVMDYVEEITNEEGKNG